MTDDAIYKLVGLKIRAARKRSLPYVSQDKLASKIGLTRASIVNIESGRQHAPLHVLWRIAEKLDMDVHELLPRRQEIAGAETPLKLDATAIQKIEEAANGDPATKALLTEFISKVTNTGSL